MNRVIIRRVINPFRLFFLRTNQNIGKKNMLSLLTELSFAKTANVIIGDRVCSDGVCRFVASEESSLSIGDNCYFNTNCFIGTRRRIIIGKHCLFGPGVSIIDNNHGFEKGKGISSNWYSDGEVVIGNECWFGANVTILKDSHIGDGCIIGAGCVVKGNIPSNSIVTNHSCLHIHQIEDR